MKLLSLLSLAFLSACSAGGNFVPMHDLAGTVDAGGSCGDANQPCCMNNACGANLTCKNNLCVSTASCGQVGEPCCMNSPCAQSMCVNGTCVACGFQGQTCCPNNTCAGGLMCSTTPASGWSTAARSASPAATAPPATTAARASTEPARRR